MKRIVLPLATVLMTLCSCNNRTSVPVVDDSKDTTDASVVEKDCDTSSVDSYVCDEGDENNDKSLNDIRFADFKENDWLDNEYIRTLRKYIDDYNDGKIEDGRFDTYKENIRGKFVIWKAEPSLLGGLFIQFIFIDSPDDIFSSWVYSHVDEKTESVTGYAVRGIRMEDQKSGFTKEDILDIVQKDENIKLW